MKWIVFVLAITLFAGRPGAYAQPPTRTAATPPGPNAVHSWVPNSVRSRRMRRSLKAPELMQRFERDLFLSMDADVPTLNRFIAGELKRWTAFFQDSGLKPQ